MCGCEKVHGDELRAVGKDTFALCHTHKVHRHWGHNMITGWIAQVDALGREGAEGLWQAALQQLNNEYSPA
jgi:hypothetical protein